MHSSSNPVPRWDLDHVPYKDIDLDQVRAREDLYYMVAGASFVEIASDLYTDNLIRYFEDDPEVVDWLRSKWQLEEVRHGHALRGYVQHVWPEFDWEHAYRNFFDEYSRLCTLDELEPTRGLEMAARCVVETGTATFYHALSEHAVEPVLAGVAARIRAEEVGHYKYFFRFFNKYSDLESLGRWRVLGAIKRRVLEARQSDADCALWHVYTATHGEAANKEEFRLLCRRLGKQLQQRYPMSLATKMLLKPLDLPGPVTRAIQGPLARASAWLLR